VEHGEIILILAVFVAFHRNIHSIKMKVLKIIFLSVLLLAILLFLAFQYFQSSIQPKFAPKSDTILSFKATRLLDKPIIYPSIHPILEAKAKAYRYTNINSPSLIKVPDWVDNKLGNYYCYFAHHKGPFIRVAYADSLTGKWTMYDSEIMPLANAGLATKTTPALGLIELKSHLHWTEFLAMIEVGTKAKKAWEEGTKQKITPTLHSKKI